VSRDNYFSASPLPQVQSVGLVVESKAGMIPASTEKEKELLKLKKTHALQQYGEGYIDMRDFGEKWRTLNLLFVS
jgi:hypothetical protein